MSGFVRGVAIALVVVGLFSTVRPHTAQAKGSTVVSSNSIPVPVCPPNDPNACHIDQW
jgi:hypothetical protein